MLGERLVELRKQKGLTQEEFSSSLNISRGTYAQYEIERRQPDYDTLKKIADFFKVSIDYLLGRTDNPTPPSIEDDPDVDLQPTQRDRVKIFQKKLGELSPESMDFLEFQLNRLHELDLEVIERKRAERAKQRNK